MDYELKALVFLIKESDTVEHIISCLKPSVRIGGTSGGNGGNSGTDSPRLPTKFRGHNGGWVVFNDFMVSETTEAEAIQFAMDWKIPCVLYYCKKGLENRVNMEGERGWLVGSDPHHGSRAIRRILALVGCR